MMRLRSVQVLYLLIVMMILGGCRQETTVSEVDITPAKMETASEEERQEISPPEESTDAIIEKEYEPLPDTWTALDEKGILWHVPNKPTEEVWYPEILNMDGCIYVMKSKFEHLEFYQTDPVTGEILASHTTPDGSDMIIGVQEMENGFAISDSGSGWVQILDRNLDLVAEYEVEATRGQFYVSSDGKTLYDFQYTGDLTSVNLETGVRTVLMSDLRSAAVSGANKDMIFFSYVKIPENTFVTTVGLDLKTGTIEPVPIKVPFENVYHCDGTWVKDDLEYYLVKNEEHEFVIEHDYANVAMIVLLSPTKHILRAMHNGRLDLFQADGTFISSCWLEPDFDLDAILWKLEDNLVWSENYGGYFLMGIPGGGEKAKVLFWNVQKSEKAQELQMIPYAEWHAVPGGELAAPELYERARKLSEEYGIDIRIADQCEINVDRYSGEIISDKKVIEHALDVLEDALSLYPRDFFRRLSYSSYETFEIHLVDDLRYVEAEMTMCYDESYSGAAENGVYQQTAPRDGVVETIKNRYWIAIDARKATTETYHRQIARIIEKRISWTIYYDGGEGEKARSEWFKSWNSLTPEEYPYGSAYEYDTAGVGSYFVDSASRSDYLTDRIAIFASAMEGEYDLFQNAPGLQEKLEFICNDIRTWFYIEGWPKILPWEKVLQ